MKLAYCPYCKQQVHFYQKDPPKTINCPRCGATNLIVKDEEEDCPVCHGAGATTDHHDPCTECGGSGKVAGSNSARAGIQDTLRNTHG